MMSEEQDRGFEYFNTEVNAHIFGPCSIKLSDMCMLHLMTDVKFKRYAPFLIKKNVSLNRPLCSLKRLW